MPYKVKEDLYSDTNPVDPEWDGQVSTTGGNFQVASAGGVLTDADAVRLKLTDRLEQVTQEQVRAEQEAVNRATYDQNIGVSPAHSGYPTAPAAPAAPAASPVESTAPVAPSAPEVATPAPEPEAQPALTSTVDEQAPTKGSKSRP